MRRPGPQHPQVWRCACGCANGWWRRNCIRCLNDPPASTPAVPPATPIPAHAQGAASLEAVDAGGPSQQAEDATALLPASPASGLASLLPPEVQAQIAGDHVIPSGKYKGKKIAEVKDDEWFQAMLGAKDSPTRSEVEVLGARLPPRTGASMTDETYKHRKAREAKRDRILDFAAHVASKTADGDMTTVVRSESATHWPRFKFSSPVTGHRCECGMPMAPFPTFTKRWGLQPTWFCPVCGLDAIVAALAEVEQRAENSQSRGQP